MEEIKYIGDAEVEKREKEYFLKQSIEQKTSIPLIDFQLQRIDEQLNLLNLKKEKLLAIKAKISKLEER